MGKLISSEAGTIFRSQFWPESIHWLTIVERLMLLPGRHTENPLRWTQPCLRGTTNQPQTWVGRYHIELGKRFVLVLLFMNISIISDVILLIMAKTAAVGNFSLSLMSAWMVGNVPAPAKANMIELKAVSSAE